MECNCVSKCGVQTAAYRQLHCQLVCRGPRGHPRCGGCWTSCWTAPRRAVATAKRAGIRRHGGRPKLAASWCLRSCLWPGCGRHCTPQTISCTLLLHSDGSTRLLWLQSATTDHTSLDAAMISANARLLVRGNCRSVDFVTQTCLYHMPVVEVVRMYAPSSSLQWLYARWTQADWHQKCRQDIVSTVIISTTAQLACYRTAQHKQRQTSTHNNTVREPCLLCIQN